MRFMPAYKHRRPHQQDSSAWCRPGLLQRVRPILKCQHPANDPGTHTPPDTTAPTTEIYLQEVEGQSKPVDAELALLAEQRAMHVVHRYQTLSVNMSANAEAQSAVAPEALCSAAPAEFVCQLTAGVAIGTP